MPTEIHAASVGEIRSASTAGGGTALSTTPVFIQLPKGAAHLILEARNFATAVVAQIAINPWLVVLKTADGLATSTDYSDAAQDASVSSDVVLSSLDTLANLDAVWIGAALPFRGLAVDIDAANSNASVLAAHYYNGTTLTTITPTDGTASGGATFAVDGNITWTMPTDWVRATLLALVATATNTTPFAQMPLYWVRLTVSAALDASTTINSLLAMNRSTAYWELTSGRAIEEAIDWGSPGDVGCIEARTDAGTASLIINVASSAGQGFV